MLSVWRRCVGTLLTPLRTERPPALRRCTTGEALLVCDLPLCAERDQVQRFAGQMLAEGWQVREKDGWLWLDRPVERDRLLLSLPDQPECGCLKSLAARHPELTLDPRELRLLAVSAEAGGPPLLQITRSIHSRWAAELRERRYHHADSMSRTREIPSSDGCRPEHCDRPV